MFDRLFEFLYPKVKYFVLGLCHDEEAAENLTQDLFMKLWIKRDRLRDIENLNAYIFTTAHHSVLNYIRHTLKLPMQPIEKSLTNRDSDDNQERDIEYRELLEMVYAEIDRMPEQRRKIFLMSREEGLSNQEIADRQGISRRTVEGHISAALNVLRKLLPLWFILNFTGQL